MSFAVDRSLEPDGVCVAVAGEVDIDSAPRMHQPRDRSGGRESVTVDLGALTFMDPSGLAALISTGRPAEAAGLSFRLQRVPPAILRLLALTGIDAILTINPASALARPGPRHQPDAPAPAAGHLFPRGSGSAHRSGSTYSTSASSGWRSEGMLTPAPESQAAAGPNPMPAARGSKAAAAAGGSVRRGQRRWPSIRESAIETATNGQ